LSEDVSDAEMKLRGRLVKKAMEDNDLLKAIALLQTLKEVPLPAGKPTLEPPLTEEEYVMILTETGRPYVRFVWD